MKIAVNTRLVIDDHLEGIGRFTLELLRRMIPAHPEVEFHLMFDRRYRGELSRLDNVVCHRVFPPMKHVLIGPYWFDVALRWELKKIAPDVFLSTDSMNMLHPPCKTVSVLHDLNFEHDEVELPSSTRSYYKSRAPIFSRNSDALVTVSQFSASDIAERYGIDPSDIDIVANGVSDKFVPQDKSKYQGMRQRISEGKEYFLFVGGMYHRKNLVKLVKAFEQFKLSSESDTALVLAGRKVNETAELLKAVENSPHAGDIYFPGRISDQDLPLLYSAAKALTYVSVLEGFGIPVLEAFCCGCPAIVADNTSLPEIAGDAGLYVDAFDVDSIAGAMLKMDSDPALRQALSEKAIVRSKKFTWKDSADRMWEILENVVRA